MCLFIYLFIYLFFRKFNKSSLFSGPWTQRFSIYLTNWNSSRKQKKMKNQSIRNQKILDCKIIRQKTNCSRNRIKVKFEMKMIYKTFFLVFFFSEILFYFIFICNYCIYLILKLINFYLICFPFVYNILFSFLSIS